MKYYYDLHIHSALSPCGDNDMTPNNIVNMVYLKGLNIFSVTDHNSAKNARVINELAHKLNLIFIPGIEVTTREDVHILCYFKNCTDAETVGDIIYDSLPDFKNKIDIFGEQNIYNVLDEVVGSVDKLLINACKYSINEVDKIVKKHNGIVIPAHVNKTTNGILGVLGFFPLDVKFELIEINDNSKLSKIQEKQVKNYKLMHDSDAHYLENISEPINYIELDNSDDIYKYLQFK